MQKALDATSTLCPRAILIEGMSKMALYPGVHKHVAGPGIESPYGRGAQIGEICDSPDIEDDAMHRWRGEHRMMEGGDQRSAFATGSDVATPEIANHDDACQLGEQRPTAELDGVAGIGPVADGLAVTADSLHARRRNALFLQQLMNGPRIDVREFIAK